MSNSLRGVVRTAVLACAVGLLAIQPAGAQLHHSEARPVAPASPPVPCGGTQSGLVEAPGCARPPDRVRSISRGDRASGDLPVGEEQLFSFRARADEGWNFVLGPRGSSKFEPRVELFEGYGTAGRRLAVAEQEGPRLIVLDFVAPRDASYTVRITGAGETSGAYQLTIRYGRSPRPTEVLDIDLGETVAGTFSAQSPHRFYRLGEKARAAVAEGSAVLVAEMAAPAEGSGAPLVEAGLWSPGGFDAVAESPRDGSRSVRVTVRPEEFAHDRNWIDRLLIRAANFPGGNGDYELTLGSEVP